MQKLKNWQAAVKSDSPNAFKPGSNCPTESTAHESIEILRIPVESKCKVKNMNAQIQRKMDEFIESCTSVQNDAIQKIKLVGDMQEFVDAEDSGEFIHVWETANPVDLIQLIRSIYNSGNLEDFELKIFELPQLNEIGVQNGISLKSFRGLQSVESAMDYVERTVQRNNNLLAQGLLPIGFRISRFGNSFNIYETSSLQSSGGLISKASGGGDGLRSETDLDVPVGGKKEANDNVKSGSQQYDILSNFHPSLAKFKRIHVLDVKVSDYSEPIVSDEFVLVRIEQEKQKYYEKLLEFYRLGEVAQSHDLSIRGKFILANGNLFDDRFSEYLFNKYTDTTLPSNPIIVGIDTTYGDWIFVHPPKDNVLNIEMEAFQDWVHFRMVQMAIPNVRNAVKIENVGFQLVKFSRIKQSSHYLETGTIKFDGCEQGAESLNKLRREFPHLHDVIILMHNSPEFKVQSGVLKCFKDFLLTFSNIIKSDSMFLPTSEMIEANQELKSNQEIWHMIRRFMENCCESILGEVNSVEIPEFGFTIYTQAKEELNRLVAETDHATKALKSTFLTYAGSR